MEEQQKYKAKISNTINIYRAQSMALKLLDKSQRLYMISTKTEPAFIWVSQSWLDYLGWTFDEMTTTPFTEFIHPDDLYESMEIFEKFQKTGKLGFTGDHFVNRYKTKQGFYKRIIWESVLETDDEYYMMEAITENA